MVILGIDPGLAIVGGGVSEYLSGKGNANEGEKESNSTFRLK